MELSLGLLLFRTHKTKHYVDTKNEKKTIGKEFDLITAKDLLGRRFSPRQWMVEGLVKQRQLALVYAGSGLGKSWLSWSIACMVAGTGKGLKDYTNETQGRSW